MIRNLLRGLLLLAAIGLALQLISVRKAQAALVCSFSMTNVNLGTVDPAAFGSSSNVFTTGTFSSSCTGGAAGQQILVCGSLFAGSGNAATSGSPRYMLNGATRLNYNLYQNSNYATVWGGIAWRSNQISLQRVITLNASGAGSDNYTIYARIFPNQTTVPPGTYSDSFSGTQSEIIYANYAGGSTQTACATMAKTNLAQIAFSVTAILASTCTVSATAADFGAKTTLSNSSTATNTISVRCGSGLSYTVGLSGGQANATNPMLRQMSNGAGSSITYGIYSNSIMTLPWGNTIGTDTVSGTGTGATQNIPAYLLIPSQTTPAAGTYSDTIIVTVTY